MKKFIIKFIIFAAVVVVVDLLVGYAFGILQHKAFEKNPLRFEVRTMYAIEHANSEIDIIGASDASHSYISNQIADSLGLKTFNYGKDGCFFIYQNCLINLMLEHHTPKVIIWEIGKDCLAESMDKNREWQSIKDFYPYYRKSDYCRKLINSRGKYQRFYMLSGLYRFNSSILSIVEPFITSEIIDDSANGYLPLPNEGYNYPEYKTIGKTENIVDNVKIEILKGTLEKCKEKDIKVVFCFSPKYNSDIAVGSLYYTELERIANHYHVALVDYRNVPPFDNDATLFKDNAHLNDKGARLYMKYFIPDIKNILSE